LYLYTLIPLYLYTFIPNTHTPIHLYTYILIRLYTSIPFITHRQLHNERQATIHETIDAGGSGGADGRTSYVCHKQFPGKGTEGGIDRIGYVAQSCLYKTNQRSAKCERVKSGLRLSFW